MIKLLAQNWAHKYSINSCHKDHHCYYTLQEKKIIWMPYPLQRFSFQVHTQRFFRCFYLNLRRAQVVTWEGQGHHHGPSSTYEEQGSQQSFQGRSGGGGRTGTWTSKPELFLNDTQEFRTPGRRPSRWDLGSKEARPLKGRPFYFP